MEIKEHDDSTTYWIYSWTTDEQLNSIPTDNEGNTFEKYWLARAIAQAVELHHMRMFSYAPQLGPKFQTLIREIVNRLTPNEINEYYKELNQGRFFEIWETPDFLTHWNSGTPPELDPNNGVARQFLTIKTKGKDKGQLSFCQYI